MGNQGCNIRHLRGAVVSLKGLFSAQYLQFWFSPVNSVECLEDTSFLHSLRYHNEAELLSCSNRTQLFKCSEACARGICQVHVEPQTLPSRC